MKNKINAENTKKIIELYKSGMIKLNISKELNLYPSSVQRIITIFERSNETEFFNVDKYDCWIMPERFDYIETNN